MIRKYHHSGFTLIELIMVMVILSVISIVISKIMLQGFQSFTTSQNISQSDWQGFIALERITDDIHNIRSAADITTISSSQLNFIDANGVSVQYSLSGSSLLRNSQILANGITAMTLGYLDKNGTTTATASNTRYVSIALTLTQGNIVSSFATLVGTRGMP